LKSIKLAVIDIGSNAIRFQMMSVLDNNGQPFFKKVEYIRFPLRLGHDVFTEGRIGLESEVKFIKLMQTYKNLIDLYEADMYMACATSAMRESVNGAEIAYKVKTLVGLNIDIIDGNREAEIIANAISSYIDYRNYIHIDVGGGSTELNIYVKQEKIAAKSFAIGSVRKLENGNTSAGWKDMKKWVKKNTEDLTSITAIGTGGNINKIFELATEKQALTITIEEVERVKAQIESYSMEDREIALRMNSDRADVIIPATEIYLGVMQFAKADKIIAPDVGLKDGMVNLLYQQYVESRESKVLANG
jgi:exopolyphosphatase / guanosine-5'-triphosphate,3'-diphosphate pyrophosphatase